MYFNPALHYLFDLLAVATSYFVFKINLSYFPEKELNRGNIYIFYLLFGAFFGAYFFGSINLYLTGINQIGHSVVGAILGGTVSVEIYKLIYKIKHSTGYIYVLPLCLSIAIGRLGCFFSGLKDNTYGIQSNFFLAINFGDGIKRHPVQIYEAINLILIFLTLNHFKKVNLNSYKNISFYLFVLLYAVQRFILEFLKPYKSIFLDLNVFHIICFVLIIYSITMLKKSNLKFEEK